MWGIIALVVLIAFSALMSVLVLFLLGMSGRISRREGNQ